MPYAHRARLWWSALVVEARPAALSFLRLQPDLDCLSRQPFCSKAFVVCMEFWLGLAVRYRLPRRKRVESPSLELVRNLLLGRPLRLDHLLFPFSPSSTRRRMASEKARQADTATHVNDWLNSPGLQPPK